MTKTNLKAVKDKAQMPTTEIVRLARAIANDINGSDSFNAFYLLMWEITMTASSGYIFEIANTLINELFVFAPECDIAQKMFAEKCARELEKGAQSNG